jgi:hypothetical protein
MMEIMDHGGGRLILKHVSSLQIYFRKPTKNLYCIDVKIAK